MQRWITAIGVTLAVLGAPAAAQAHRYGLASSVGGATLNEGHMLWLAAGFPSTSLGWGMAVHPRVDIGVYGQIVYTSPADVSDSTIGFGGGGGISTRIGLIQGRIAAALVLEFDATVHSPGSETLALLNLGSPALHFSFRIRNSLALHAAIRADLRFLTEPQNFMWGVEVGGGITGSLTSRLFLFGTAFYGTTVTGTERNGTVALEVLVGLEYRLGVEE